jgi:hypothetical protein
VVNGGTSLPILLVVHVEGDGIRGKQLCKGGGVRQYESVVPECDILEAKLDRPSSNIGLRHCVLAHTKQKEESSGDQVRSSPGERCVRGLMEGAGTFHRGNR